MATKSSSGHQVPGKRQFGSRRSGAGAYPAHSTSYHRTFIDSDEQEGSLGSSSNSYSLHVQIDKPTAIGIGAALIILLLLFVCVKCCKKKAPQCYEDCPPLPFQQPSSPYNVRRDPYPTNMPSSPFMATIQPTFVANAPSSPMQHHQSYSNSQAQ